MKPQTPKIPSDAARLRAAADFVRNHDTAALLPLLLPGLDALEARALEDRCHFSHAALLVFPPDPETLHTELAACGLAVDPAAAPVPSVVVRDRLAARHRRDPAGLDVRILRPSVPGPGAGHRTVEVFALTVPPGSALTETAEHERAHEHEAHLAFEVAHPDPLVLRGMCGILTRHGAVPDGGGYNPHEDGTVFYFTAPDHAKAGYRRVELSAPGDHREVLAAHLAASGDAPIAETLLRLLTGAWTTQALSVFAALRLPDAMSTDTATAAGALARRAGADPESLSRLLRYLATLNVVAGDPETGFRLTRLGALLRADAPGSLRPLALLYGGPFYQSFAALDHTVRTGETAFDHLFGTDHFDHFARRPELAELFDRSMAASTRMFDPLTGHPVITAASTVPTPGRVVDIAGGNGELLARLLIAHPRLHGTLLERPHAVEAARRTLAATGCGDRCTYVMGDFADVPTDGDVYVLSRVLHDWDDDRCVEILRHCARAMPAHAELLIIERLLPTDGSPSLAVAWDLHMMCNVGGRERTAAHYARLLTAADLTLLSHAPLPLDGQVLHAHKAKG
ncbi:methyltransferase [Streptomyces qinzhouensis]|uniref:Methyltransferase n=1 Tax=Streptomyces qinzhouensis TaxID=2599401 RepID=A0A5B8ILM7_9ACTN|nr:methyltransferase [Streptomyces qinzhouensis]QDY79472.1 methyltransferase [Streptomyces qinzhouensis]